MLKSETIAAIGTAPGNSGIGIVRISGPDAVTVADQVFRGKKKEKKLEDAASHTIHYGYIYDEDEMIDEVLVMVMRGPHSYTAEDTVEINCHGGTVVIRKILETVIRHGCSLAEPGEFTKRAFLNGRVDLSQAEAVIDLINAKNDYARRSSMSQLNGAVSEEVKSLRAVILYHMAYIESALDDPEHISLEGYGEKAAGDLEQLMNRLDVLIRSAENGRIIKEGIKTVILGKPNAGKSSLMNVMLGEERAIVTDIAGTTRDTLEEQLNLHGINLNIVDTAGIRESNDVVEQIGVSRARSAAEEADLIIYVIDGSCPLDENDDAIISLIQDQKAIVILNKMDLDLIYTVEELECKTGYKVISVSAKEKKGIEDLEASINSMFYRGELNLNDEVVITNVRHKKALSDALLSLTMVKQSIDDQMPEDFYSIDLMDAYQSLGRIIGEEVEDDLVNEIFSKFCMGK